MIRIAKDGFHWQQRPASAVEPFLAPNGLGDPVFHVEEGVTLGDLIRFVYRDEVLNPFISGYCRCSVDETYEQIDGAGQPPGVEYCAVSLAITMIPDDGEKTAPVIPYVEFHGWAEDGRKFALELEPLTEIAGLPFRLVGGNAEVRHLRDGKLERVQNLDWTPTLLDILASLFRELSFHGDGENKARIRAQLTRHAILYGKRESE